MLGSLLAQALGDFQAIHRVYPVKVLGHWPRLVALDRPDAVPDYRQMAQRSDLFHRFLNVVFTKRRLPGLKRSLHRRRWKGFGNGQKCDRTISPVCCLAGTVDAGLHRP